MSGDPALVAPPWSDPDFWIEDPEPVRTARERAIDLGCLPVERAVAATLRLLARLVGAKAIVEVGTGTGVSAAALLAGAVPGAMLTSIDIEAEHQRIAREMLDQLGFEHAKVRLIAGRALNVLPRLSDGAYDVLLADADCQDYAEIAEHAARLLRPGGVAVFTGVLSSSADQDESDAQALLDLATVLEHDAVWTTALLPVGTGLLVACRAAVADAPAAADPA